MNRQDARSIPGPYRGIHPFRYVDRAYFFGREAITQDLFAEVLLHRLVVFFGDSGAGKSSLVNAGLIPALEREGLRAERIRVRPIREQPLLVERIAVTERDGDYLPSIFANEDSTQKAGDGGSVSCSLADFLAATAKNVGTGLKRSHFHRFEGKHWVPVFEVRRHECVGSMKKEPAVLQSQV